MTISPPSETVRPSVPDEPELIVLGVLQARLLLLLAEAEAAFLHL